jgi:hypothetical protein
VCVYWYHYLYPNFHLLLEVEIYDPFIRYFSGSLLHMYCISYWASWSDRPFIMGHVEDELMLVICMIAVLETF